MLERCDRRYFRPDRAGPPGLSGWHVRVESQQPSGRPSQPSGGPSQPSADCAFFFFVSAPGVVTLQPQGAVEHQTDLSRSLREKVRCPPTGKPNSEARHFPDAKQPRTGGDSLVRGEFRPAIGEIAKGVV